jgi:hypothetical protein
VARDRLAQGQGLARQDAPSLRRAAAPGTTPWRPPVAVPRRRTGVVPACRGRTAAVRCYHRYTIRCDSGFPADTWQNHLRTRPAVAGGSNVAGGGQPTFNLRGAIICPTMATHIARFLLARSDGGPLRSGLAALSLSRPAARLAARPLACAGASRRRSHPSWRADGAGVRQSTRSTTWLSMPLASSKR